MINKLVNALVYLLYVTLFLYAVPTIRYSGFENAIPYTVIITGVLWVFIIFKILHIGKIFISRKILTITYIFIISSLFSLLFANYPNYYMTLKYGLFFLTPMVISLAIDKKDTLDMTLRLFLLSGVVVFIYGLYGYITGNIGIPSEHALNYFGVTYLESTRNSDMLYLHSTFYILLAYVLFNKDIKFRFTANVLIAFLGTGMLLSFSRGTWISVLLTIIIMLLAYRKRIIIHNWQLFLLFFMFLLIPLILSFLINGIDILLKERLATFLSMSTEGGNSNLARVVLINKSINIALTHPWGVGIGNFRYYITDFAWGSINHAENAYLQILVEQGIFGLFALISLFAWMIVTVNRIIKTSSTWIAVGFSLIIINWIIYSIFNVIYDHLWFWFVIGLIAAFCNRYQIKQDHMRLNYRLSG